MSNTVNVVVDAERSKKKEKMDVGPMFHLIRIMLVRQIKIEITPNFKLKLGRLVDSNHRYEWSAAII